MKTITLFALAIAAIATTPAQASEPVAATSIVHTADLDLSSQFGQQQLDQRLAQAAREVCGTASPADLEGFKNVRLCRQQTVAAAVAQREQLLAAARAGTPIRVAAAR
jgi:UrcA family protein